MKIDNILLISQLAALASAGLIKRDDQCSCSVDPSLRKDCGYYGIQESECVNIGCCWGPSNVNGAPWCFYTASGGKTTDCHQSSGKTCEVDVMSRKDCGYYGINQNECISRGCCWAESSVNGVPWCFYSQESHNPVATTTTPPPAPTTTVVPTTTAVPITTVPEPVPSTTVPAPGPEPTNTKVCPANEKDRRECGYLGITKSRCVAGGCCWTESKTEGVPWCFNYEGEDIHIENPGVVVRFQKPNGWNNVNLWAWDATGKSLIEEAWPGKQLEDLGNGWVTYTFDKELTPVNFLFNNGYEQTGDISNVSSSGCYKFQDGNVVKAANTECGLVDNCQYKITGLESTSSGMSAILDMEDRLCEKYDLDIKRLKFDATFETNDRLHVHITPEDQESYPHNADMPADAYPFEIENEEITDLQYSYELTDGENFKLNVKRNDGTPVFESVDFVFEQQYLEISKKVHGAVYGFGEAFAPYKRNSVNTETALFNGDNPDPVGQNLYGSHPFYIEIIDGKAYGFLLKNSHGMEFSIKDGLMRIQVIGGNFDMYFFMGPTMEDVTKQYYKVIGAPALFPYWSLGWHQCRYGYKTIEDVQNVVDNYKKNNIPLDTMWIDIDYMENNKDFTYDRNRFPVEKVKKFVENLKKNNQYYINMIDPAIGIEDGYAPFKRGMEKDIFIKDKTGDLFKGRVWPDNLLTAFPDWHHPNILEYWTNEIRLFKDIAMTDGNWIDMNEAANFCYGDCRYDNQSQGNNFYIGHVPEQFTKKQFNMGEFNPRNPPFKINNFSSDGRNKQELNFKTLDMDVQYYGGLIDYDIHNIYGHMESIVSYKALTAIDPVKRPFLLSRSTFPGTGKYAAHWLGDNHSWWSDMYYSITGMLTFQFFGIPMVGSDTCGFQDNANEELCARWMQLGAFNPFGRNHNGLEWDNRRIADQEPYIWKNTAAASRYALGIRYNILPYMYTLLVRTHTHSEMILYSFAALWPNDQKALDIDRQFLVGKGLLITPVLTDRARQVTGYFPEGKWYEWDNHNKVIEGPRMETVAAPIEKIPVHIRGGHIITTQGPRLTVYENRNTPFKLLVALDGEQKAEGRLYLDDGSSLDVAGKFSEIEYAVENNTLASKGTYNYDEKQPLEQINVLGVSSKPSKVIVNGSDAQFDFNGSELIIKNLRLSMNDDFEVSWN